VEMDEVVTRDQFEKLTAPLLKRTHQPIDTVLSDAGVKAENLDRIILVGGSTRMPMVAKDIKQFLGQEATQAVHPDFAVAGGAAILAGIMSGEIDPTEGLVMTDVNPFTLGIRTANGMWDTDIMSPVIPRNSTIPIVRKERYSTLYDGQREATIDVYQGESMNASHNYFLGTFTIQGIPAKPAGHEKLDVEFAYDLNGLLKVTATLVTNGKQAAIEIDMKQAKREKPEQQETKKGQKGKEEQQDPEAWKQTRYAAVYRTLIRTAERMLKNATDEVKKRALQDMLDELKQALVEDRFEDTPTLAAKLSAFVEEMRSGK